MEAKYILGIGIPLVLILAFSLIGILNIGLSIIEKPTSSINRADFFFDNQSGEIIAPSVMTITIKNDFFMQRIIPINYVLCIKEVVGYSQNLINYKIYVDGVQQVTYNTKQVTLNSGETKVIEIKPYILKYDYQTKTSSYDNITELLIFKYQGNDNYYVCSKLLDEKYNEAIKVRIV